jgi:hypothetical protein
MSSILKQAICVGVQGMTGQTGMAMMCVGDDGFLSWYGFKYGALVGAGTFFFFLFFNIRQRRKR